MVFLSFILLSLPQNAYAAQSSRDNEIISFDEYYSAMKEEYAKYGITYEIYQKNDDYIFTKGVLRENLNNARQQGKIYKQQKEDEMKNIIELNKDLSVDNNNQYTTRIMPVTVTKQSYQTVSSPMYIGSAEICLETRATVDVNNDKWISVNYVTSYQSGAYVNFKSWVHNSSSYSIYVFPGTSVSML